MGSLEEGRGADVRAYLGVWEERRAGRDAIYPLAVAAVEVVGGGGEIRGVEEGGGRRSNQ